MTKELDPLQAQAIQKALGGRDVEVSERDFRRPRRLSPQVREGIRRQIESVLPKTECGINAVLGSVHTLQLDHVRETTAEGLFDDLTTPVAALAFEANGNPAWLIWESKAAVACVEEVLGCPTEDPKERHLSPVEAKVLEEILTRVAEDLTAPLEQKVTNARIAQTPEALGSWRDKGAPDAHRVELALGFVGPGEPSSMKFYLPGVKAEAVAHLANPTGELPPHLANVEVEVCARLMGCEVSLDQLLALEKGDVIPIAARVGDPALLTVEGLILAKASLGQHRNQLAVKIEHIEKHVEEMQ